MELLIARNPDPESTLPYLLRLPLSGGLVFRVKDTWPRTNAIFCYPVSKDEWPATPDLVERVTLRVCERRGAAIDVVADRGREARSQIVFTHARGREMVFWQSPRTRKQSRPQVRVPLPVRPASPSWRSSSMRTSVTPTPLSVSRCGPRGKPCPAATMAS